MSRGQKFLVNSLWLNETNKKNNFVYELNIFWTLVDKNNSLSNNCFCFRSLLFMYILISNSVKLPVSAFARDKPLWPQFSLSLHSRQQRDFFPSLHEKRMAVIIKKSSLQNLLWPVHIYSAAFLSNISTETDQSCLFFSSLAFQSQTFHWLAFCLIKQWSSLHWQCCM